MKKFLASMSVCVLFVAVTMPAFGHHGYAAYDETVTKSLKGTVTEFELMNPHSTVSFDVKAENGKVENWTAEAGHVRLMLDLGWKRDTLKKGDVATFYFHPAKNGSHSVDLVKVEFSDGHSLYAHSSKDKPATE